MRRHACAATPARPRGARPRARSGRRWSPIRWPDRASAPRCCSPWLLLLLPEDADCMSARRVGSRLSDPMSGWYRVWRAGGARVLFREVRQEQGLVDAALEDGDAHLHTLFDDFATLEARLPSELRGREVNCHRPATSCEVCHVEGR